MDFYEEDMTNNNWDEIENEYDIHLVDGKGMLAEYKGEDEDVVLLFEEEYEFGFEHVPVEGIMSGAFDGDKYLRTVVIPDNISYIEEGTFCRCERLTDIIIVDENTMFSSMDGVLYNKDKTAILAVPPAKEGAFVIPDSVTSIGNYAFANCKGITKITIPDSVTSIGNYAFANCKGITEITIPDSVTSIGSFAFVNCESVAQITIPDSVTSIGDGAFINCSKILLSENNKDFILEDGVLFDKDKTRILKVITNTAGDFTVPDGVTRIDSEVFTDCREITCINIPDSVTSISDTALIGCKGLTKVNLSENNPQYSCPDVIIYNKDKTEIVAVPDKAMVDIVIPESILELDGQLDGCSFTGIAIPNSNCFLSDVDSLFSDVHSVIRGCSELKTVRFYGPLIHPKSVELGAKPRGVIFSSNYFWRCPNITDITLPEHIFEFQLNYNNDFSNLENFYISENNEYFTCENGILYNKDKTAIICVPRKKQGEFIVPDTVTVIGKYAFTNCTGLTHITLPNGITEISSSEFCGCTNLTDIIIPDGVTIIGNDAFANCTSLTHITIPDSVTHIGNSAFGSCSSLTSITIPDSVTVIDYDIFAGCTNLTDITIPDGVTHIGASAFQRCTNLKSITIPDSVTRIGRSAFRSCSSLTSITIPDSVTVIDYDIFAGCRNLTSINIPDGVTHICDCAFASCTSLTSIHIPDGVKSIGDNAFIYCENLTSINIPDSVLHIGELAFSGCTGLTSIKLPDTIQVVGPLAFDECENITVTYKSVTYDSSNINSLYKIFKKQSPENGSSDTDSICPPEIDDYSNMDTYPF